MYAPLLCFKGSFIFRSLVCVLQSSRPPAGCSLFSLLLQSACSRWSSRHREWEQEEEDEELNNINRRVMSLLVALLQQRSSSIVVVLVTGGCGFGW
jgi:hypothetical protein